jgi:hypothetical protein
MKTAESMEQIPALLKQQVPRPAQAGLLRHFFGRRALARDYGIEASRSRGPAWPATLKQGEFATGPF